MPAASDEQVPKPLTYTLMYHGLWAVMFFLSYLVLAGVFISSDRGPLRSLAAPWPLLALAVVAAGGFLAAYGIRLSVLVGDFSKDDAFRWSAGSSWVVIVLAPLLWGVWWIVEPRVQAAITGGQPWAPPEAITSATFKVEVVVWWLSHLLSIRGLPRGRRKYLAPPARYTADVSPPAAGSAGPNESQDDGTPAAPAAPGAPPAPSRTPAAVAGIATVVRR
jgi:hypothetical protein